MKTLISLTFSKLKKQRLRISTPNPSPEWRGEKEEGKKNSQPGPKKLRKINGQRKKDVK